MDRASGTSTAWETTVVLGDGDTALIRPLTPADRSALAAFHRRQSRESIYRRFFSPKPELTEEELTHFTTVDMVDRVALCVELHDEFVGWASYERWPGRNEAEAAFMVDDEHHGKGIATLLLEHLAAIATANGIERFTAEVLGENRAMLAVFAKAGWPLQRRFDSGVVDLDWDLATTDEYLDSVERREHRADSRAVARILLPRAVAVVGASDRPGSIGSFLWRHVVNSVEVPAYPVNPRLDSIDGHPCAASIDELPEEVSLAIIAVPPTEIDRVIDACIGKRMRGAVIITDVHDTALDVEALVARARRNGLRIIGPSSMGIASPRPESRLQAALVDVSLPAGGVAISMQSGSLGGSLLRQARDLSLGVSWFVSLGDKSDISANDLLQFWEDDDTTSVIALYTETFGNPNKFSRLARRISRQRPIVAVRTGAAATGSDALFQQAGVIEVPTVHDLLDTTRVLVGQPVLRGSRVAVVSNSRSPGVLASAALRAAGLEPVRPPVALDWRSAEADYQRAMAAALDDDGIDGVMVIHAPAVVDAVNAVADGIDATASGAKPVVAVMLGAGDGPVTPGSDVPAYAFPEQAAAALGRSYVYGRWLADEATATPERVRSVDPDAARDEIARALDHAPAGARADVATQRALLAAYGISMPMTAHATPSDVVRVADEIGYPVAIKSAHRRAGRSARAGVALDIGDPEEAERAVAAMRESPGVDADRLTVQTMVMPGVDVRIKCEHDENLGAVVQVGLGGVQADVIGDKTTRLAPVSPASATAMLAETVLKKALEAARIDPSTLVAVIVQAAHLAADHPEIEMLDLNPIVVSEDGAWVVDAEIRLGTSRPSARPMRTLD